MLFEVAAAQFLFCLRVIVSWRMIYSEIIMKITSNISLEINQFSSVQFLNHVRLFVNILSKGMVKKSHVYLILIYYLWLYWIIIPISGAELGKSRLDDTLTLVMSLASLVASRRNPGANLKKNEVSYQNKNKQISLLGLWLEDNYRPVWGYLIYWLHWNSYL